MKTAFFVLALTCAVPALAAEAETTIGGDDCKVVNLNPVRRQKIHWNGACKDGYADGPGTLEWFVDGDLTSHFEGSLKRGRMHGDGYWRNAAGTQYEGSFADGRRNGKGVEQRIDRSIYEGEWKNDRQEGRGAVEYATGGHYEGYWKAGRFHGPGKATYTSGKVVEGEFHDGMPPGQAAVKVIDPYQHYSLATKATWPDVNNSPVPFKKTWETMTADEQRAIRQLYKGLLNEEDEPPYPARGTAQLYQWIAAAQHKLLATGTMRMNVAVDSSGTPTSVSIYVSPNKEITKVASFIVMKEKFKPALCAGTPCPMIFPFAIEFGVD